MYVLAYENLKHMCLHPTVCMGVTDLTAKIYEKCLRLMIQIWKTAMQYMSQVYRVKKEILSTLTEALFAILKLLLAKCNKNIVVLVLSCGPVFSNGEQSYSFTVVLC